MGALLSYGFVSNVTYGGGMAVAWCAPALHKLQTQPRTRSSQVQVWTRPSQFCCDEILSVCRVAFVKQVRGLWHATPFAAVLVLVLVLVHGPAATHV